MTPRTRSVFGSAALTLALLVPAATAGMPIGRESEFECELVPIPNDEGPTREWFFALERQIDEEGHTTYYLFVCGDNAGMIRSFTCPNPGTKHRWPSIYTSRNYNPRLLDDGKTKAFVFKSDSPVMVTGYRCPSS